MAPPVTTAAEPNTSGIQIMKCATCEPVAISYKKNLALFDCCGIKAFQGRYGFRAVFTYFNVWPVLIEEDEDVVCPHDACPVADASRQTQQQEDRVAKSPPRHAKLAHHVAELEQRPLQMWTLSLIPQLNTLFVECAFVVIFSAYSP